jgi:hypothetical protein
MRAEELLQAAARIGQGQREGADRNLASLPLIAFHMQSVARELSWLRLGQPDRSCS